MKKPWIIWLIAVVAVLLLGLVPAILLLLSGQLQAAVVVDSVRVLVLYALLGYGVARLWEYRVVRVVIYVFGTLALLALAWTLHRAGHTSTALTLSGMIGMAGAFVGGLWLVRLLLLPGTGITGVARTLVDEAIRMKVALVFIVLLVLVVPLLPFMLDPRELLEYRLQFFLTWAVTATGSLLSLMTLFLACATVCNEIEEKQVYLTMTKPVSRWEYLLGKWLGIVLLNAVLVSVAGGGIYTFAKVLSNQPARSAEDYLAVHEQVLSARNAIDARPPGDEGLRPMFEQRVTELRREDPVTYGERLTDEQVKAIQQQVMLKWHTIPPRSIGSFMFSGLQEARELGPAVQLRMKPKATPSAPGDRVWLVIRINGRLWPPNLGTEEPEGLVKVANDMVYVMNVPTEAIDAQGNLLVEIGNANPPGPPTGDNPQGTAPGSVSFTPGEGMQMLYKVGSFEANLVRGMAMIWLRLTFIAMLGIAAGTFLTFPVACLLCLLIYFTSAGSAYLAESLESYAGSAAAGASVLEKIAWPFTETFKHLAEGKIWDAVKVWIKLVGTGFMALIPSLGEFNPTPNLTDGRVITWHWLGRAAGNVGLLWTAAVGVIGYLIFRKRELARVTV